MNALKQQLIELGLEEEKVDQIILTVANFVKTRIPANYHGMIDDVLAGNKPDLGGILGGLGGLFGKK